MAKSQETEAADSGKSLAVVKRAEQFPIIYNPALAESSMKMLESMGVGQFDLQRIKVPSGGGQTFELQTLKGVEAAASLEVVITAIRGNEKQWWKSADPSGDRPSCQSFDGIHGNGINSLDEAATPGKHECATCAWNQFGTSRGKSSRGKDCKDTITLFFFRPGSRLPGFISVPPTSLKAVRTYSLALLDAGKTIHGVVTRISLVIEKSQDGTKYAEIKLDYVGDLEDAEAEARNTALGQRLIVAVSRNAGIAV